MMHHETAYHCFYAVQFLGMNEVTRRGVWCVLPLELFQVLDSSIFEDDSLGNDSLGAAGQGTTVALPWGGSM